MARAEENGGTARADTSSGGGGGGGGKGKRTRGPRSCLECRSSKQRCEQMNFAAIVPSNEPQPLHMACRRCRVLQLACIVPDQLPKSTRLRIERSQSITNRTQSYSAHAEPTQAPSMNRSSIDPGFHSANRAQSHIPIATEGYHQPGHVPHQHTQQVYNVPPPPPSQQHPSVRYEGAVHDYHSQEAIQQQQQQQQQRQPLPSQQHVSHFQPLGGHGPLPSPGESSSAKAQSHSSRSPASHLHFASGQASRFDPAIFDPLPVMRDGQAGSNLPASPSLHVLPPLPGGGPPPPSSSSNGFNGRQVSHQPPAESPHSQSSGGADAAGEPTWYYRARIACRPAQLLEHMLINDGTGDREFSAPDTPSLTSMPRLEDVVHLLLGNAAFMRSVDRRMTNMQRALPFMPSLHVCAEDVQHSAFLLGAIMHLEGRMPANEAFVLHQHLTARCAHYVQHPPETMYDIAACLLIASFCPLLVRAPTMVGAVSGNALLQSATRAATLLKLDAAPLQLATYLDNAESTGEQLPSLDSALVLNAFLWLYLIMQEVILELIDDPMPRRVLPQHPRYGASRWADSDNVAATTAAVDRYCRALIEQHALSLAAAPPQPLSSTSPTHGLHRCASMVLCSFATRIQDTVCQNMRSFSVQFEEQVRRVVDTSSRVMAMRRWCDQAIENLGVTISAARESLRDTAIFLGERHVASSIQLKYFELSVAAIEFSALCQLKDKLYVAGHGFLGPTRTSQEFLFGIFARPQLLKSYESLGIVRACVAKHVLMLLANMAMDLQPVRRKRDAELPSRLTNEDSPVAHWGGLAHTFPLARWCGLVVACVTVLVEELAGRFLAQEAPWGAQGESRLETYTMVIRKTYESLVPFEEDAKMRYHGLSSYATEQGHNGGSMSDQVWTTSVTLDALEKALNAMATWRKKASGVGEYERPSPHRLTQAALDAAAASVMKSHPSHLSAMSGLPSQQMMAPGSHSMAPPPSTHHAAVRTPHSQGVTGPATPFDQVHFGDALLHDILFTPIEQFFGADGAPIAAV